MEAYNYNSNSGGSNTLFVGSYMHVETQTQASIGEHTYTNKKYRLTFLVLLLRLYKCKALFKLTSHHELNKPIHKVYGWINKATVNHMQFSDFFKHG